jgi:nucleoside-diphosphate-sugar epimerase
MLIVGCGAVGSRIAAIAKENGAQPCCVVRSESSVKNLNERGLDAHAIDLDLDSASLPPDCAVSQVFYFAPPPPTGTNDPRMRHFLAMLGEGGQQRIVYISTSGVYGDCAGEWVDESRPANPQVDRARRRYDAEQQLLDWRARTGGDVVILRVAGIYGPERLPLDRLRRQAPMVAAAEAPWTNRIHIEDLVQVCLAAMARGENGAVYNVSDGTPGNMRDYFDRVADLYGLPRPPLVELATADGTLSSGMLSYLRESRRLDNRRMLRELQVELRYPTLAAGLDACVVQEH